jgi:hypothetical protein
MLANFPACTPLDDEKPFFTSTASMSLALGLYLGYECIETWGIDLASNTEYSYQLPGWIYWCGVARAMLGKNFVMHSGQSHFKNRLYGYEGETQIERDFFAERAIAHLEGLATAEKKMLKIKSRLDDVITDRKFDDFPRLYVEAMDMTRDYAVFSGRRQEAKTYAERPDPIPRQQFERRGATAQRDAQLNSSLMEKEGGKVEYVFNAWKSTGSIEALQQVRVFMAQALKYALMVGGNTGVMQENMLYLQEYDKRVEAAGGERTLTALGV